MDAPGPAAAAVATAMDEPSSPAAATALEELFSPMPAGATAREDLASAAGATVLDEPAAALTAASGPSAAATAVDATTGLGTAAATALDDGMGPSVAATAVDAATGLGTAAATALDDGMGLSAAATAAVAPTGISTGLATALDEGEGPAAAAAGTDSGPEGAAEGPPGAEAASDGGDSLPDEDEILGELRELFDEVAEPAEAAAAEAEPGVAAEGSAADDVADGEGVAVEDVLGELSEMRQEEEASAAPAGGAAPAAEAAAAGPGAPASGAAQFNGAAFIDESRYMQDQNGAFLHKWKVDYATRGGGGVAMCRDLDCLERHAQGGVRSIEKGELRIGRRVLMDKDGSNAHVVVMWHHARCIFNTFLRSRKSTRCIESVEDLEGFHDIQQADQELLRRIIAGNEDVRAARSRTTGPKSTKTPEKRPVPEGGDRDGFPSAKKARGRKDEEKRLLRKGDRVWTYCRVRPPAAPDRPDGVPVVREFAVKSPKPELGLVAEEVIDDQILIQFESAEHEQERIEKYMSQDRRLAKIRAWFAYPRVFEGKKQRLPLSWVQSRPPPKLCGCAKQQFAHACDCGITCTRGTSTKVWGVCQ